jgi:hypothetical protein
MAKRRRGSAAAAPNRASVSKRAAPTGRVVGRTRPIAAASTGGRGMLGPAVLIALVVVAGIAVVGVGLFSSSASPYECGSLLQPVAGATVENPIVTADEGRNHVQTGSTARYASCPPASGPHYNEGGGVAPLRPAFYEPGARVGPGNWVHNLEHGYVIALYRCEDGQCPFDDVLSDLRQFIVNGPSTETATRCGYQSKVLAVRFDDMATPFALVAWDHVLPLDAFDPSVALEFARRWIEQPELPERGSC